MILHDVYNTPTLNAKVRLDVLKKAILVLDCDDEDLIDDLLEVLVDYENDDYFGTEGFEV